MRNVLAVVALCVALVSVPAYAQKSSKKKTATTKTTLKTSVDSASYAVGVMIAQNLQQQPMQLNAEILSAAISDVLNKRPMVLTMEQCGAVITELQQSVQREQMAKMQQAGAENRKAGEAFLAENGKRTGVTTLPSGLQYEIITAGTGAMPTSTDNVTTHYKGTLLDGTTFDSSYDRGEPASFKLDQVIKGWTEALQLMSVGSKWRLYIPSDLAYGEAPPPGSPIGPNSTLIFEVELLKIN